MITTMPLSKYLLEWTGDTAENGDKKTFCYLSENSDSLFFLISLPNKFLKLSFPPADDVNTLHTTWSEKI
jgi:hypothetical protein